GWVFNVHSRVDHVGVVAPAVSSASSARGAWSGRRSGREGTLLRPRASQGGAARPPQPRGRRSAGRAVAASVGNGSGSGALGAHERFKKKTEQVQILLDDLKKLSRFDSSTVPTLQRMIYLYDAYNREEGSALVRAFHKEGGIELFMKMLTCLSPDASNIPDYLQRPMERTVGNLVHLVFASTTAVGNIRSPATSNDTA
ncbi:unnamed protein product, partial [Lampetra fluviatilis]